MLKIYLRTIKYEIHTEDHDEYLRKDSHYVIRSEDIAVPKTIELGAYTENAMDAYCGICDVYKRRKGCVSYFDTWDGTVYLKEWKYPDAKLVMHVSYEEESCSMAELMRLDATDVIAYLKQEGMNLILPS